jgi:hypothetical protein
MQFFEQICGGRTVISPKIERDAQRVTDDVYAVCWLDAKQRLGYPLSTVQQCLLDTFLEERACTSS